MNKIVLICCAVSVYIGIPLCCILPLHATNSLAHANILTCGKINLHVQEVFAHAGNNLDVQNMFVHEIRVAHV